MITLCKMKKHSALTRKITIHEKFGLVAGFTAEQRLRVTLQIIGESAK